MGGRNICVATKVTHASLICVLSEFIEITRLVQILEKRSWRKQGKRSIGSNAPILFLTNLQKASRITPLDNFTMGGLQGFPSQPWTLGVEVHLSEGCQHLKNIATDDQAWISFNLWLNKNEIQPSLSKLLPSLLGEATLQSTSQIHQGVSNAHGVAADETSPVGCPVSFQNTQQTGTDGVT